MKVFKIKGISVFGGFGRAESEDIYGSGGLKRAKIG